MRDLLAVFLDEVDGVSSNDLVVRVKTRWVAVRLP